MPHSGNNPISWKTKLTNGLHWETKGSFADGNVFLFNWIVSSFFACCFAQNVVRFHNQAPQHQQWSTWVTASPAVVTSSWWPHHRWAEAALLDGSSYCGALKIKSNVWKGTAAAQRRHATYSCRTSWSTWPFEGTITNKKWSLKQLLTLGPPAVQNAPPTTTNSTSPFILRSICGKPRYSFLGRVLWKADNTARRETGAGLFRVDSEWRRVFIARLPLQGSPCRCRCVSHNTPPEAQQLLLSYLQYADILNCRRMSGYKRQELPFVQSGDDSIGFLEGDSAAVALV